MKEEISNLCKKVKLFLYKPIFNLLHIIPVIFTLESMCLDFLK